ncbi:hypothetical protein EYF80_053329 [Liparis tanakae]|uniref:Uncharacterized protein n=1 Tax=Liparis tanakae TaxID=230148 RepID=A0A4Z2F6V4_9TELE|nr:hypothetical protein EYF80_053329 [Liparis tanakae]
MALMEEEEEEEDAKQQRTEEADAVIAHVTDAAGAIRRTSVKPLLLTRWLLRLLLGPHGVGGVLSRGRRSDFDAIGANRGQVFVLYS